MQVEPEKLYTTPEVASQLAVSEITIKRYIQRNIVPSIRVGGLRRIKGIDLQKLLERGSLQNNNLKGFELHYPRKKNHLEIINSVKPAKTSLKTKYGKGKTLNRLYTGDNLPILKSLSENPLYRGQIDLIYIDPPFGTGQTFIGHNEDHFYHDNLINFEFIEFIRERLVFLKELLSPSGSIYLHIDSKIGHYVKIVMDEIFGDQCFRNDITRIKCNPKNFDRNAYGNIKDVIYFYSRSPIGPNDRMFWADYRHPLSEEEIFRQFPKIDRSGRRYATTPLHAKGETRNGPTGGKWKGLMPPKGRHWRYSPSELSRLDKAGLIEWSVKGNPRKKIYADENRGKKIQDIWDFKDPGYESALYPTEKNFELLRYIISNSSPEGGLVLDCFAGSGTTIHAAHSLGRKWIGIDANKKAVEVTKKRILSSQNNLFEKSPEFEVYC